MNGVLQVIQAVVSILLIGAILVQSRGTGFGRGWSASQASFSRRGIEKLVFKLTFVLASIFIIVSTLQIII